MFFLFAGFVMGMPLGFYFKEHKLQPPVVVNISSIKKAFEIFENKEEKDDWIY